MDKLQISLAAARVNAGMTQKEVANALGVGNQTIVSWEKGTTEPKASQVIEMSRLFNIPIDNIFLPYNLTISEKSEQTA